MLSRVVRAKSQTCLLVEVVYNIEMVSRAHCLKRVRCTRETPAGIRSGKKGKKKEVNGFEEKI